ncbi:MAG: hypothetical protein ACK56F_02800, partial [bacterium]
EHRLPTPHLRRLAQPDRQITDRKARVHRQHDRRHHAGTRRLQPRLVAHPRDADAVDVPILNDPAPADPPAVPLHEPVTQRPRPDNRAAHLGKPEVIRHHLHQKAGVSDGP